MRPERRLPADSLCPGQSPAHETRCPAVGNTDMSRAGTLLHDPLTVFRSAGNDAIAENQQSRIEAHVDIRTLGRSHRRSFLDDLTPIFTPPAQSGSRLSRPSIDPRT